MMRRESSAFSTSKFDIIDEEWQYGKTLLGRTGLRNSVFCIHQVLVLGGTSSSFMVSVLSVVLDMH